MKIYLYNANHLNEYSGDIDSERETHPCGTKTKPPTYAEHAIPVWNGTAWDSTIPDWRGSTIYCKLDSRKTQTVYAAGEIPATHVLTAPPDMLKKYVWQNDEWTEYVEPVTPVTVQDYDDAMEAHLKAEREARGYTTREPDYYINSSVARWKQDAQDWIAHRDAVMLYALEIENKHEAGEAVPTLDEFKAALPKIQWTLTLED